MDEHRVLQRVAVCCSGRTPWTWYTPGCSRKTIIADNPVRIYGFNLENLRSAHVPTLKIRTYIKKLNIHLCHISTRRAIVEFWWDLKNTRTIFFETCTFVHQSDWMGNKGCPPFGGPPSKIRTVLPRQRVVTGVGTCKSGVGNGKAVLGNGKAVHLFKYTYTYDFVCMYIHIHTYIYICICICTYVHIRIHVIYILSWRTVGSSFFVLRLWE